MKLSIFNRGARRARRANLRCAVCVQRALCVVCALVLINSVALAQAPGDKALDAAEQLSAAARAGNAAEVKRVLDGGVDVNTKFRYNRTALSFAADRGHVEVVKLLIERGADLNVKDTFYNATALTWAINPAQGRTPQHDEVVRVLLQHGAQGKATR